MTNNPKDGSDQGEADKKPRRKISGAGNAKEASEGRSVSVRGIMERNRRSGES